MPLICCTLVIKEVFWKPYLGVGSLGGSVPGSEQVLLGVYREGVGTAGSLPRRSRYCWESTEKE